MATKKEETSVKTSPVLKKRTSPDDIITTESTSTSVNPLKKRILPGDEPIKTVKEKKEMPLKKKTENPLDQQAPTETKEKSSLEQMKERIAAQKKLEQDMMTQQSIRSQEKGVLRNKLSALNKELSEEVQELIYKKEIIIKKQADGSEMLDFFAGTTNEFCCQLIVPIIKDGDAIGSISILAMENKCFDDSSIKICKAFSKYLSDQIS